MLRLIGPDNATHVDPSPLPPLRARLGGRLHRGAKPLGPVGVLPAPRGRGARRASSTSCTSRPTGGRNAPCGRATAVAGGGSPGGLLGEPRRRVRAGVADCSTRRVRTSTAGTIRPAWRAPRTRCSASTCSAAWSTGTSSAAGRSSRLQGKVEVQRANQTEWDKAREKQPLYNGDFIKTGPDASAEIIFSDSTVYRVGPDSLLEVHREARTGREPSAGEVKVKVGQVNVYTATNPSSVVTDAARAEVDRDSRVGVEVGGGQRNPRRRVRRQGARDRRDRSARRPRHAAGGARGAGRRPGTAAGRTRPARAGEAGRQRARQPRRVGPGRAALAPGGRDHRLRPAGQPLAGLHHLQHRVRPTAAPRTRPS